MRAVDIAAEMGAALLVGTTGLTPKTVLAIEKASQKIPAIKISNSSLGIAILTRLAALAATLLGTEAVISIRETHHVHKKDAPSGTALALAEALTKALGKAGGNLGADAIESLREGEVVGEHRVTFAMEDELLVLEHRAIRRDLFALGAIRIADWLRYQPPGMHGVDQWLSDLLLRSSKA